MVSYLAWNIGCLAEYVIAFLVLLVILIITLITVHRRHDPLRMPFIWLKLAIVIFFLFVILRGISSILIVVNLSVDTIDISEPIYHLSNISAFLSSFADVFTLFCLIELGLSCLRALGKDGVFHNIIRYANIAFLVVLSALAVAALGTGETYLIQSDDHAYDYGSFYYSTIKLLAAFAVIYWITALVVISLAIGVLIIAVGRKYLQNIATLFLVASIFNLARTTYGFVYAILYYIIDKSYGGPHYLIVVDPVLYTWFSIIVLGILMGAGYKKLNGLWSQQPIHQPVPQPIQQGHMVDNRGGNTFYGQELPVGPSQPYYGQQHRHPSELGSGAPAYRAELGGYASPQPQYYAGQNHQQPTYVQNQQHQPYVQNQMQYAGPVPAPAPTHSPVPQYNEAPTDISPRSPGGDNFVAHSPHQQQPHTNVTPDHKG